MGIAVMLELAGYQFIETLYQGTNTRVERGIRTIDGKSVVVKLLQQNYPSYQDLLRFRNQYTIAKNLNIPGIVHPQALETYGNGYALVMEDTGAISLADYIKQQRLSIVGAIDIAVQLAEILHHLHLKRVIHKDIKPANILIHPQSKQVQLIDFSIASLLPKETQELKNPNQLEGTLAYLAPEQTGRMNRGIDYRADFYALGVTLFELLTQELPFPSLNPLEVVHCHIAKIPTALANRQEIPQIVCEIVMKLMAKNAEDRYQSALGLKFDLERCLYQLKETGKIETFEIATRDAGDRFIVSEKLYGREGEIAALLAAFARVAGTDATDSQLQTAHSHSEMILVAGCSGIGKTAVINEVHKPITRQQSYFIKGKFDQFNRSLPLAAFVQAVRDLIDQLLSEPDAQLSQWKAKILQALGESGQVLIDVIPELERIIGVQPAVPELSGVAVQNRLNLLFQKFIEVFARPERPLVIFIDDLQWADVASLQFIKLLLEDKHHLLFLGAYRDNEVSPTHPFMVTVKDLKKAGKTVQTLTLTPLTFDDTNQLVADTLQATSEQARPLSELIDRKTRGNPFFTTQFLKALAEERYLVFNREECCWQCDLSQVQTLAISDDVVEFMATQLQKLPETTQHVIKLAACIGERFDLAMLAIVSERSPVEVANNLWQALQDGLIIPQSEVYKLYLSAGETVYSGNEINSPFPSYKFLHDRVQQAAYSLIPDRQKSKIH